MRLDVYSFSARGTWRLLYASALMLALGLLSLAITATASAHATPDSSNPAPGAHLQAAPTTVSIHFVEDVKASGSDIIVYDAHGSVVSTGPAQVDTTDAKTMHVAMHGDDAEVYLVVWHTVSADDGDPDVGAYTFFVGTAGATSTTVPGSASSGSGGMPIWLGIVLGLVGLAVGALGGVVVSRRSVATPAARC